MISNGINARYLTGNCSNMTAVIAKRDIVKFYINLLFSSALFIFFAALCLFKFTVALTGALPVDRKYYFLPLVSISLTGFCFYYIREYVKKVPSISLTDTVITFNATAFFISDISSVKFTGKRDFIFSDMECTMVIFKNNTAKIIYDDMYSNIPELKLFLDKLVNNKNMPVADDSLPVNISKDDLVYFKGIPWLNFRVIMIMSFVIFSVFIMILKNVRPIGWIFPLIISILFYFVLQGQFYYFAISDRHLVIKNHFKFWTKHIYRLDSIELISLEQPRYREPNAIKIIFKNYTKKKFYAASLSTKKLKEFKNEFRKSNTNTRNEIYI